MLPAKLNWTNIEIIFKEKTMKFFIDTANINEIREAASMGMVDGVTTNPSMIAKE